MKFALILSGCGQHDGSETHETVTLLLALCQEKVSWDAFAPNADQQQVINHLNNQKAGTEKRNMLIESARLVRGHIKPINEAELAQYDAIIFPGGLGAVTNLCDWKEKGMDFSFQEEVKEFLEKALSLKKPMGFICIAPVMIAKIFQGAKLTIGNDQGIAKQVTEMGSHHVNCSATDVVVDETHKVVSTPANMLAQDIGEVYAGIHKLVKALVKLAR